jgi:hypothetical protein
LRRRIALGIGLQKIVRTVPAAGNEVTGLEARVHAEALAEIEVNVGASVPLVLAAPVLLPHERGARAHILIAVPARRCPALRMRY